MSSLLSVFIQTQSTDCRLSAELRPPPHLFAAPPPLPTVSAILKQSHFTLLEPTKEIQQVLLLLRLSSGILRESCDNSGFLSMKPHMWAFPEHKECPEWSHTFPVAMQQTKPSSRSSEHKSSGTNKCLLSAVQKLSGSRCVRLHQLPNAM